MADLIAPTDVEELERAVNDSAGRVSTIWISYLIFGLYLIVAAVGATQRQLFLGAPIKLPVLNIDLPLVGFFFLAPILFVILHVYVLTQIVVLARTAAAYNAEAKKAGNNDVERARLRRQRITNTVFAQIFSGEPGERRDLLGPILRATAFLTLALGPLLVILAFEIKFLSYHSYFVTWSHRVLLATDLLAILLLWTSSADLLPEISWRRLKARRAAAGAALGLLIAACLVPTFPGEFQAAWARTIVDPDANTPQPAMCRTSFFLRMFQPSIDRLVLPVGYFVDEENVSKIEGALSRKGIRPFGAKRTRDFRSRNLTCGDFQYADLRLADFRGADLTGAKFAGAALEGAIFQDARLPRADLYGAELQSTNFLSANLEGANLDESQFQGASLFQASLKGASLDGADLRGTELTEANLQGATLSRANLQGALLANAKLQGATISDLNLSGAVLDRTFIQGATFTNDNLKLALFYRPKLWRASIDNCDSARVIIEKSDLQTIIDVAPGKAGKPIWATPQTVEALIAQIAATVPEIKKRALRSRLQSQLAPNATTPQHAASTKTWLNCSEESVSKLLQHEYADKFAMVLRKIACDPNPDKSDIAQGIFANWIGQAFTTWKRHKIEKNGIVQPRLIQQRLAHQLLDPELCHETGLDPKKIECLQNISKGMPEYLNCALVTKE